MHPDIIEPDYDEARAEARAFARSRRRLDRHPDCRDPDHPGCPDCWDGEEETEESGGGEL